jgi:crotonobetainyl-CoA:carnitine CoA-transferase CaiB-like acyl-CoA transferase
MMHEVDYELALSPYRALDLTDEKGMECGKILAFMGMDVIKVEPPGGSPARCIGPFYHDSLDPEESLFWFVSNVNKRGITLDITKEDGKALFLSLVKKSDIIIESFPVGYLENIGLTYGELCRINPRIVIVSITGFGQTGPYSSFKAPDIVCMATGGEMNIVGTPGRPPLRIGIPQAYLHAGAEAAAACLAALWRREETGKGQRIDISAQECVAWLGFYTQTVFEFSGQNITRQGSWRELGRDVKFRFLYPTRDGYISFIPLGGVTRAESMNKLVAWMEREGFADEFLRGLDWALFTPSELTPELAERMEPQFERFFLSHSKEELFSAALADGHFIAPVYTAEDILKSPHFKARDFWIQVEHPELGESLAYPGAPFSCNEQHYTIYRRAPLIGEHNREVFCEEMGLAADELVMLKAGGII